MSREEDQLLQQINKYRLPEHVAIIMDGNGRWAKRRRLPRLFGHRAGSKTVRRIVESSGELGIRILTLYAFSTENWSRPRSEVDGLMRILKQTLKREVKNLNKNNVRLDTIGDLSKLPQFVRDEIRISKEALSKNTGLTLVLALNYGSRQEIVQAVNTLLREGHKRVSEKLFEKNLQTTLYPDPDLLIRTSDEFRISNFLLWQIAYTEIHITPVLWPDFDRKDLYKAIIDYQGRERRYGALN